jgi:hypothetical protein
VDRVFDYAETSCWPSGELVALGRLALIREATSGLHAPCPNCDDGHIEKVSIRKSERGAARYFIHCLASMRVEVTAEMCLGWSVDLDALARMLSAAMDMKQKPKVLVAGRLWRLGRIPWKATTREVVLAIRLCDADASSVTAHIGSGGRSIVFVPHHKPDEIVWPGHVPAVVALSRVATLGPQGIELDVAAMTELVTDADAMAEKRSMLPVDPEVKKQVVRQQAKAEIKGHLEDDVLIAAYKQYGSLRKAAEALTDQLGRTISKDKVSRAVQRAGGAKAVRETDDSASVARTVASQPRDRGKKFIERR